MITREILFSHEVFVESDDVITIRNESIEHVNYPIGNKMVRMNIMNIIKL